MDININDNEYKVCLRCGRKLKSENSRKLGFGKVCWEKWQTETQAKKLFEINKQS